MIGEDGNSENKVRLPAVPITSLDKNQFDKLAGLSESHIKMKINPMLLLEFSEVIKNAVKSRSDISVMMHVIYRNDYAKGGAIIAEVNSDPKQYIGLAGMEDE